MRYIHTNLDGSIGIWATIPKKLIRDSDKKEFKIFGVRRENNQCFIYGEIEIAVGDMNFDVSDMPTDHIKGYTIVFPNFQSDILAKLPEKTRDQVKDFRICTRVEIPADRTFRGAWIDTGKVDTDMTKAREIHKDNMRSARKPKLEALDVEYMKALEAKDIAKQDEIIAKKQELRDVTEYPAIAEAKTSEELKIV